MVEASVDAIVCDPPYGLEFMGKEWDTLDNNAHMRVQRAAELNDPSKGRYIRHSVEYSGGAAAGEWHAIWATAAARVLKPGGHLLAFGGTRTFHRLACALEDAGFEIRDCLMWLYGSGFPKSLDVSKAIDKTLGFIRPRVPGGVGTDKGYGGGFVPGEAISGEAISGEAISGEAIKWNGWGSALKPAFEPIILARKPLAEPTVAANVQQWGTGAINVNGCRIGTNEKWIGRTLPNAKNGVCWGGALNSSSSSSHELGRWPANLCLDEAAAAMLDEQSGELKSGIWNGEMTGGNFGGKKNRPYFYPGDSGGASRFFYTSKASREDRDGSKHPTVKPTDLCQWLVTLVGPPGGVILDPFCGSGPIVWAARELGFQAIGIDREAAYLADAIRRLRQAVLPFTQPTQLDLL
jgi:DNA modification methylase